jgi:hypothetical protein
MENSQWSRPDPARIDRSYFAISAQIDQTGMGGRRRRENGLEKSDRIENGGLVEALRLEKPQKIPDDCRLRVVDTIF